MLIIYNPLAHIQAVLCTGTAGADSKWTFQRKKAFGSVNSQRSPEGSKPNVYVSPGEAFEGQEGASTALGIPGTSKDGQTAASSAADSDSVITKSNIILLHIITPKEPAW